MILHTSNVTSTMAGVVEKGLRSHQIRPHPPSQIPIGQRPPKFPQDPASLSINHRPSTLRTTNPPSHHTKHTSLTLHSRLNAAPIPHPQTTTQGKSPPPLPQNLETKQSFPQTWSPGPRQSRLQPEDHYTQS